MTGAEMKRDLAELHPASFAWALGRCRWKRDEAQEVLQSSYLKVLEGRARFDGRSSLRAWFFGVIRNTAAEHRRRRFFREMLGARLASSRPPHPMSPDPEMLAEETRRRGRLIGALGELPGRQREVLELVTPDGKGPILVEVSTRNPTRWDSLRFIDDKKPSRVLLVSKARTITLRNGRGTDFERKLLEFLEGRLARAEGRG